MDDSLIPKYNAHIHANTFTHLRELSSQQRLIIDIADICQMVSYHGIRLPPPPHICHLFEPVDISKCTRNIHFSASFEVALVPLTVTTPSTDSG